MDNKFDDYLAANMVRSQQDAVIWVREMTSSTTEQAKRALLRSDWNIAEALDVLPGIVQQRKRSREESPEQVTPDCKELVLITWNIDGLCERGLTERFSAVISTIKNISPHVVLLQEVVEEHVQRIKDQLGLTYDVAFGDICAPYFNAILINKKKGCKKEFARVRKFPGSIMGRHYVHVQFHINNKEFNLFTAHIESLREYSKERSDQMKLLFERMQMSGPADKSIVLFGGDTNLRDKDNVTLPNNFYDVWREMGGVGADKHTWDTGVNKNTQAKYRCQMRFDRVIARSSTRLKPTSFSLIGKTKLVSCDMYPSDHWGILAHFAID